MPRCPRPTPSVRLAIALAFLLARPVMAQTTGVSAAVLPLEVPASFGDELARAARRYVGVRYVWGGETPRGFDCSGFVQWVFGERGVAMPRTAREQAGVGDAPYPGDLRPGDLLFFWGGTGAQHVAIYVGRDSILHASTRSRRVQVDRIHGTGMRRDWFGQRLIAVRRVVPAAPVPSAASRATSPAASPATSPATSPAGEPVSPQPGARIAPATGTTIFAGGSP